MNSMETTPDKKRRKWFVLLHVVAWGITLAVGVAFIAANVDVDWHSYWSPYRPSSESILYLGIDGWPFDCGKTWGTKWGPIVVDHSMDHPISLMMNIVAGHLIVASTFFVFVYPLWRQKLFQVELKSLFIFTAAVAIFLTLYPTPIPFGHYVFFNYFPLSTQIPLGLGVCCAIFWYIWIVIRIGTVVLERLGEKTA